MPRIDNFFGPISFRREDTVLVYRYVFLKTLSPHYAVFTRNILEEVSPKLSGFISLFYHGSEAWTRVLSSAALLIFALLLRASP